MYVLKNENNYILIYFNYKIKDYFIIKDTMVISFYCPK